MNEKNCWLSVEQIADYLGISKETVYRWLEKSTIPGHKVGNQWRFQTFEIDDWVKRGDAAIRDRETTSNNFKEAR